LQAAADDAVDEDIFRSAPAPVPAPARRLAPGSRVRIEGLQGRPDMNGRVVAMVGLREVQAALNAPGLVTSSPFSFNQLKVELAKKLLIQPDDEVFTEHKQSIKDHYVKVYTELCNELSSPFQMQAVELEAAQLVRQFHAAPSRQQAHVATTLVKFCSKQPQGRDPHVREWQDASGRAGVVAALAQAAKSSNAALQEQAVQALTRLVFNHYHNQSAAAAAGVVPRLLQLTKSSDADKKTSGRGELSA